MDFAKNRTTGRVLFMTTPAPACESLTGLAAGGVQLVVFNTGLATPLPTP